MRLRSRVSRLEDALLPPEIEMTPNQEHRLRTIIDRYYADPVRFADKIALIEKVRQEEARGGPR